MIRDRQMTKFHIDIGALRKRALNSAPLNYRRRADDNAIYFRNLTGECKASPE